MAQAQMAAARACAWNQPLSTPAPPSKSRIMPVAHTPITPDSVPAVQRGSSTGCEGAVQQCHQWRRA